MISIIVAAAKNRVIGRQGNLLWHLKDDMARFKELTAGHPVIMGRKTFESIPEKYRPLPNRTNIIITRNESYKQKGATVVNSLARAIAEAHISPGSDEVFVIGGGEIYTQSLPSANRIYYTEVNTSPKGDTVFPKLDDTRWKGKQAGSFKKDKDNQFGGKFVVFERTGKYQIVEPLNARLPEFKRYLVKILKTDKCPFCRGGVTHKNQEILYSNKGWWLTLTVQPLKDTFPHFMIVPFRHVTKMQDITPTEWKQFQEVLVWAQKKFMPTGTVFYWRQGESLVTGASVSHLHVQAIVPRGLAQVYFGYYPKKDDA